MNAPVEIAADKPLSLTAKEVIDNKFAYYAYLREHLPVHRARILSIKLFVTSRYEDCLYVVKSDDFARNKSNITGGRRFPFPLPKNVAMLAESMITEDDPEHRRLRNLVQKAFAPKRIHALEDDVRSFSESLLEECVGVGEVNLQQAYALPIPVRVIGRMMGVDDDDMDEFRAGMRILSEGMSGWGVLRTVAWDVPKVIKFTRALVQKKRSEPGEDILSALIHEEEDGDRLSEDEIIAMVFLLIIAGFETTVHLISNGVIALLEHPDELATLRARPELMGSAVEEMLRFAGPVHGTKMNFARRDLELRGVSIPRGSMVMPLLGSANRDESVFTDPDRFDVQRDPNKHLAFSQGNHFCLGAFLARMETRVAMETLLSRSSDMRLAVPASELQFQRLPGWHRYQGVPVVLDA